MIHKTSTAAVRIDVNQIVSFAPGAIIPLHLSSVCVGAKLQTGGRLPPAAMGKIRLPPLALISPSPRSCGFGDFLLLAASNRGAPLTSLLAPHRYDCDLSAWV